jgi:hypothetical protein
MFFMYETMVNGGWIELSKSTVRYFDGSVSRRRFRPFVYMGRLVQRLKFHIKERS